MDLLMLPKDQVAALVDGLLARYRVIAPVRADDGLRFEALTSSDEMVLNYRNTTASAKSAFFPQVECMIRFGRTVGQHNVVSGTPIDRTPTLLLGVRPCDARSFLLLDRVFTQPPYVDPYYVARRESTVVISLACDRPRPTCFCNAFDSGPYDAEGSDVALWDAADAYLVKPISDQGREFVQGLSLSAADDAHIDTADVIRRQAESRLRPIEPVAGIEKALPGLFDSDVWQAVSEKCLACGTCTYVCPECHCFNIEDRLLQDGGERVRAWDSCMYPGFTVHASGHNPRPDQAARWRQRTMHKFEYLPRNVDLYGCVGCGRCILACPVGLDIRQVLESVREAAAAPETAQESS